MKTKPNTYVLGFLALVLLALAGYWFLAPRDKEVATLLIKTAPAERLLAVNGRIRPRLQVDIRPALGGELVALPFDVGDRVSAGQVLARVDDAPEAAAIAEAEASVQTQQATVAQAQRDLARFVALGQFATKREVEQLRLASADRQAVYMDFTTARALFDLPTGISRIEIKVRPATDATEIAARLRRSTNLKATAWAEDNSQLFEGLDAQARTGIIIKAFALITIVVGIASAMLLSIVRRQAEIGIMRAMGASKRLVVSIFVLEGTLIGFVGAIGGAATAWLVLLPLPPVAEVQSGGLPIDRTQGDFLLAITLTTLAAALASVLPARRAAQIDPVEAIGS